MVDMVAAEGVAISAMMGGEICSTASTQSQNYCMNQIRASLLDVMDFIEGISLLTMCRLFRYVISERHTSHPSGLHSEVNSKKMWGSIVHPHNLR